ncbi:MAG: HEAT repeat domain-containing protein [Legionella sp.]|nr:HEAT repeat domain-containing protein [Legionella sp.]
MISIIKIIAIIQLCLIIFFIVLIPLAKWYKNHLVRKNTKIINTIRNVFLAYMEGKRLDSNEIHFLKRSIEQVLFVLEELDKNNPNSDELNNLKKRLSELILKETARKLFLSKNWIKRYEATQCFAFGFDTEDEEKVYFLLKDPFLIVSLNASLIAIKYPSSFLINEIISIFSKGRRIQQNSFVSILSEQGNDISPFILNRIEKEENIYVKIFCYRILSKFPQAKTAACVETDVSSDNIDLKVTVIKYLAAHPNKHELIYRLFTDPQWEVRAAVAKALGLIKNIDDIKILIKLSSDSEWWVRINAANALWEYGCEGINVLKNQSEGEDLFASETARYVLLTKEKN